MLRHSLIKVARHIGRLQERKFLKYGIVGVLIPSTSYMFLDSKERRVFKSTVGSIIRFSRSVKVGLTISLDYWTAPWIGCSETEIHQRAADRIVRVCMQNGGLYIKIGQTIGAINHVLPKEYVETLAILQDKCLTREKNELEQIFLQEFGKKPEEIFRKMDKEPIAAASLAQVYKGETLSGEPVAIKVQYIDLRDRFKFDLKTLEYLLKLVKLMHPKFNLYWIFEEASETLAQELDFENEGKNAERCARDLKEHKYVYIPKVYWDLSTKRILTTEWISGIKISHTEKLRKEGLDIATIDKELITVMAEQIFHTGFVHGDPHPGNIFVRKVSNNKPQIVLLDHGLYEHLSEKIRVSLCNFWEAMVFKNYQSLRIYGKELNVEDPILFAEMLTQAPYSLSSIINIKKNITEGQTEYMIRQAQERFDKIAATLRAMPKPMVLVIRNLNTIRAIIQDHGNVVDRYRTMAKVAVRGKYKVSNNTISKYVLGTIYKAKFEMHLWLYVFLQWLLKIYLNILYYVGYDTKKVIKLLAA